MVDFSEAEVRIALQGLRMKGLAGQSVPAGSRVERWRHTAMETLGIGEREAAVLAELLLRGPQTAGASAGDGLRFEAVCFCYPGADKAALAAGTVDHDFYLVGSRDYAQHDLAWLEQQARCLAASGDLPSEGAVHLEDITNDIEYELDYDLNIPFAGLVYYSSNLTSTISLGLFRALDLAGAGFVLVDPGSAAGLDGALAKAYERRRPWFGYYWGPTAVLGKYKMTRVDIGAVDAAQHVAQTVGGGVRGAAHFVGQRERTLMPI